MYDLERKVHIQAHWSPEFGKVRVVEIDGEPWLVGKDVAIALGYGEGKSLANAVARHVDTEDKGVTELMTPGGMQKMVIINESGLYSLALSSKLPSARKFRRWVTSEVIPSIRKHGGYIAGQEQMSDKELSKQVSYRQVGRYFCTQIAFLNEKYGCCKAKLLVGCCKK